MNPVIGLPNVKYGLQQHPRVTASLTSKRAAAPVPVAQNLLGSDSEEEGVEAQVAREAEKKRSAAKVHQMYEAALADDPSVFDYDGVYDSIQEARDAPRQTEKVERKSKYIVQLKEKAEQRKREEDLAFERRQVKERQVDDHLYEDKEKFVTAAYRKKLEEDKKWKEQDKLREEEEARQDVRKIGHMNNFYANLLTSNVAFGADKASAAQSAASASTSEPASASAPASAPGSAKAEAPADKYEALRLEAERKRRQQKEQQQQQQQQPDGQEEKPQRPDPGSSPRAGVEEAGQAAARSSVSPGVQESRPQADSEQPAAERPLVAAAGVKRRNDESDVLSARERYLARKGRTGGAS